MSTDQDSTKTGQSLTSDKAQHDRCTRTMQSYEVTSSIDERMVYH